MRYLVTYDLNKPGQDYTTLFEALDKLGAKRALLSTWVLRSDYTSAQIRDYLRRFIDANDRLLVGVLGDWAAWNTMIDINTI